MHAFFQFSRFLLFGGLNTLFSWGVYLLLLRALPYPLAYSGAFIAGMFLSYILYSRFVFGQALAPRKAARFPLVSLSQYLLGVGILFILVDIMGVATILASPLTTAMSVPITFVLSRHILTG